MLAIASQYFKLFRQYTPLLYIVFVVLTTSCASSRKVSHSSGKKPSATLRRTPSKYVPPPRRSGQPSRERTTITRLPAASEQVQVTIQEARSFIGTPYRWGGTSRAGMDCSGLLVTAFRRGGIALPRTSAEQSRTGRLVSLHEVTPGDLVFFATSGRSISHVGMVTEVRGKKDVRFIHSSSSLGVIESNLFADYYRSSFVKARRPF